MDTVTTSDQLPPIRFACLLAVHIATILGEYASHPEVARMVGLSVGQYQPALYPLRDQGYVTLGEGCALPTEKADIVLFNRKDPRNQDPINLLPEVFGENFFQVGTRYNLVELAERAVAHLKKEEIGALPPERVPACDETPSLMVLPYNGLPHPLEEEEPSPPTELNLAELRQKLLTPEGLLEALLWARDAEKKTPATVEEAEAAYTEQRQHLVGIDALLEATRAAEQKALTAVDERLEPLRASLLYVNRPIPGWEDTCC